MESKNYIYCERIMGIFGILRIILRIFFGAFFALIVFIFLKATNKNSNTSQKQNYINELRKKVNYYVIALLAKIAKSDGRVSEEEAKLIIMILDENAKDETEREFLKASFNEHKDKPYDTFYVAIKFMQEVPLTADERLNILRVLVFMALIDEDFSTNKQDILIQIAKAFEIPRSKLNSIIQDIARSKNQNQTLTLQQAYKVLDLDSSADINLVKKKYRELVKIYHPDVLNSKNVSKEELEQSVKKFREVNEAYELIKKHLEKQS